MPCPQIDESFVRNAAFLCSANTLQSKKTASPNLNTYAHIATMSHNSANNNSSSYTPSNTHLSHDAGANANANTDRGIGATTSANAILAIDPALRANASTGHGNGASTGANGIFAIDPALLHASVNGNNLGAPVAAPGVAATPNNSALVPTVPSAPAGPGNGGTPYAVNANSAAAAASVTGANLVQANVGDDMDMINISMFRAIHPADMIRPPADRLNEPYFVISAALFLGLMNADEVDRIRISTSREFRCHRFLNWDQAFGFYRAFFIAGLLRHAPAEDDVRVHAYLQNVPLDRSGLAPFRDPYRPTTSSLASSSASSSHPRRALDPLCARCGAVIGAQQAAPSPVAGSVGNPIFVPSAAPTPDLSARTTRNPRVAFAAPPPAPSRAPAARPQRQVSPTPLPRAYRHILPRPFPMPAPSEELIEVHSADDATQPRKKVRTAATRIRKRKGKGKAKASSPCNSDEECEMTCGEAAFEGGPLPFPTAGSISANGPLLATNGVHHHNPLAGTNLLKRKADATNAGGSSASRAPRSRRPHEQDFLDFINSAKRAELAFQKMGNKPGDPDVHPPSSSSGSSSSSSTPSSSSNWTAVPNPNTTIPDLVTAPSTSSAPAPAAPNASAAVPDTSPQPTRPALFNALLDAVASIAAHAVPAAPASPSETDISGMDREELERTLERYD